MATRSRANAEWGQQGERCREELEAEATQKSASLADETLAALRITEATKDVAGRTLGALHEQGEQLQRIHHRTVQADQALATGEGLLGKLGGWFDPWRPKRGPRVTGPREYADDRKAALDKESRRGLGLDSERRGALGARPNTDGLSAVQTTEANVRYHESALDAISSNLDDIKAMALRMGDVVTEQDAQIGDINKNVTTLERRAGDANKRAGRLLRKS